MKAKEKRHARKKLLKRLTIAPVTLVYPSFLLEKIIIN